METIPVQPLTALIDKITAHPLQADTDGASLQDIFETDNNGGGYARQLGTGIIREGMNPENCGFLDKLSKDSSQGVRNAIRDTLYDRRVQTGEWGDFGEKWEAWLDKRDREANTPISLDVGGLTGDKLERMVRLVAGRIRENGSGAKVELSGVGVANWTRAQEVGGLLAKELGLSKDAITATAVPRIDAKGTLFLEIPRTESSVTEEDKARAREKLASLEKLRRETGSLGQEIEALADPHHSINRNAAQLREQFAEQDQATHASINWDQGWRVDDLKEAIADSEKDTARDVAEIQSRRALAEAEQQITSAEAKARVYGEIDAETERQRAVTEAGKPLAQRAMERMRALAGGEQIQPEAAGSLGKVLGTLSEKTRLAVGEEAYDHLFSLLDRVDAGEPDAGTRLKEYALALRESGVGKSIKALGNSVDSILAEE